MSALLHRQDRATTDPSSVSTVDTAGDTQGQPVDATPAKGHIGRIVAGSIVGGLIGAIAIVVGPFAGAREHVVTGSVLLVWAAAWAAVAVLSQRWTDQPQQWALVPAGFMAVAGLVVLLAAPTGHEGGWVWPLMVAALVVWMTVQSRRALHSRTRGWVLTRSSRCCCSPRSAARTRRTARLP